MGKHKLLLEGSFVNFAAKAWRPTLMNQNTVFVILKFVPGQGPQPCYAHKTFETATAAAERLNQGAPGSYAVVPMWVED